jgi:hypothetical protein
MGFEPGLTNALQYTEKAGCCLRWQPARGMVWQVHTPNSHGRNCRDRMLLKPQTGRDDHPIIEPDCEQSIRASAVWESAI